MTITDSIPPATVRIPCGIGVPGAREGPARYAIEELLAPLGLEADWNLGGSGRGVGLWYAPAGSAPPAGRGVERWVHVEALNDGPSSELPPDHPDPVALAFAWLSGGHENGAVRDRFGRVPYEGSVHQRQGIGTRAPVDEARDRLERGLLQAGAVTRRRRWNGCVWALCPTHDVDYVRKVRPGILWRETVDYLISNHRKEPLGERMGRFGRFVGQAFPGRDPFVSAIDRMQRETEARAGTATWFVKTAAHSPHDVGYRIGSLRHRLRRLVASGHEVGLHPSFHSHAHPGRLDVEARAVEAVTNVTPVSVRSHYLRWHPSVTPEAAASAGFGIDSTLGFGDAAGFRRGTCLPFRIWNPARGEPTRIREMPLAIMESALFNRRGLDADAAVAETESLMATCRRHGGVLVALWHNTLWDEDDYPGWGRHFTETLDRAGTEGAVIRSLTSALAGWAPEE